MAALYSFVLTIWLIYIPGYFLIGGILLLNIGYLATGYFFIIMGFSIPVFLLIWILILNNWEKEEKKKHWVVYGRG